MDPFAVPETSNPPLQMSDPMMGNNLAPGLSPDYIQQPPQQAFDFMPTSVNESCPPPPQNAILVDENQENNEENALR